jgi:hypothetical protein
VSLPAARLLATSGSSRCWRGTSLAIISLAVILTVTAVLAKCYVYHEAATSSYTSGVTAASTDPWWQQQQLQRLVSVMCFSQCSCFSQTPKQWFSTLHVFLPPDVTSLKV